GGRDRDDLDLARVELGTQRGDVLLVEVVLDGERLEGRLLEASLLLDLFEERLQNGVQLVQRSPCSSPSCHRAASRGMLAHEADDGPAPRQRGRWRSATSDANGTSATNIPRRSEAEPYVRGTVLGVTPGYEQA